MKEVKLKRYAGPFEKIPFDDDYIQSPIGLVPKDGRRDCRLIFHLSYLRIGVDSVNINTPAEMCRVTYAGFDQAVRLCLKEGKSCKIGKTDFKSAFHILGISKRYWRYLIIKAKSPFDGKTYYFVDKHLLFGAAISCAHFQQFSNGMAHLVRWRTKRQTRYDRPLVNYLDDFLFVALLMTICNSQMRIFLKICQEIGFPVVTEKMVWGCTTLVFLGLLIDTVQQLILLPKEKVEHGQNLIAEILSRTSKKVTVHDLQRLAGLLNFLGRAIVPSRAFTRHIYAYTRSDKLKPHHHVRISGELKADLLMWKEFLNQPSVFA